MMMLNRSVFPSIRAEKAPVSAAFRQTSRRTRTQADAPGILFLFCFIIPFLLLFAQSPKAQIAPVQAAYRRVSLVGEPSKNLSAQAEHITIEAAQTAEPVTKFWRGVFLEPAARYDEANGGAALFAARNAGASLARVSPFAIPGVLQILADGTPQMAWNAADAQTLAASEAGGVIISLTAPAALKPAVWRSLVKSAALHYGKDPKFSAARWEFAGTSEQAQVRYAAFARTVREILPDAPIGFRLTAGNPADGAAAIAKLCAASKAPLDSFGWTVAANADSAGQATERVRQALAKFPALTSTRLFPDISVSGETSETNPAQMLTLATRAAAFAPPNGANALLGAALNRRGATNRDGQRNAIGNALALRNRLNGNLLPLRLDRADVRCLAAREPGRIRLLLWREADAGDALALVRLHNLTSVFGGKTAVRIERFTRPDAPDDATDTESGELELPVLLGPRSIVLLEISPAPVASLTVSLSAPQFEYNPGETIALNVALRNSGKIAAVPELLLRSPIVGMMNAGNTGAKPGLIAAGQSKTLRYRIFIPSVLGEQNIALTAQAGAARAGLQIRIRSALGVTLETPRIDQPRPGQIAQARIRLQNRGLSSLKIALRPEHTPPQRVTVPAGESVFYTVDMALPIFDPGVVSVPLAVEDAETNETAETLTVQIGVPALCHRAENPPRMDANLSEWAGAERLGMGRIEQTSGKAWRGPSDLSATAFTQWDERYFYFACDVADDVFTPPSGLRTLTQADSVQFALSADRTTPFDRAGYGAGDHEFALALHPNGAVVVRLAGKGSTIGAGVPGAKVAVRRIGTRTLYEAAIPWAQIGGAKRGSGAAFGLAIRVNDRDGESFGAITWSGGMENGRRPGRFPPLRLVP